MRYFYFQNTTFMSPFYSITILLSVICPSLYLWASDSRVQCSSGLLLWEFIIPYSCFWIFCNPKSCSFCISLNAVEESTHTSYLSQSNNWVALLYYKTKHFSHSSRSYENRILEFHSKSRLLQCHALSAHLDSDDCLQTLVFYAWRYIIPISSCLHMAIFLCISVSVSFFLERH
jgi:hypothetical protein